MSSDDMLGAVLTALATLTSGDVDWALSPLYGVKEGDVTIIVLPGVSLRDLGYCERCGRFYGRGKQCEYHPRGRIEKGGR